MRERGRSSFFTCTVRNSVNTRCRATTQCARTAQRAPNITSQPANVEDNEVLLIAAPNASSKPFRVEAPSSYLVVECLRAGNDGVLRGAGRSCARDRPIVHALGTPNDVADRTADCFLGMV